MPSGTQGVPARYGSSQAGLLRWLFSCMWVGINTQESHRMELPTTVNRRQTQSSMVIERMDRVERMKVLFNKYKRQLKLM